MDWCFIGSRGASRGILLMWDRRVVEKKIAKAAINGFSLPVRLEIKRADKFELGAQYGPKGLPKITNKLDVSVRNNGLGKPVQAHHFCEKERSHSRCIKCLGAR